MNIGAMMQEVCDIEERGLDRALSDRTAFAETTYIAEVSSFFILWFNSRRSNDASGFGNCTRCFVIACSTICSLWLKMTLSVRRSFVRIAMPFQAARATNGLRQERL